MKKILLFLIAFSPICANANIYIHNSNFRPYIGIDAGVNIADYTIDTTLDDVYYSATINAGARIGRNFGVELFFAHSSNTDIEFVYAYETLRNEFYYMSYGFDIFGYYPVSPEFDFFTSFGVANYKTYIESDYVSPYSEISDTVSDNNVTTRFGIGLMYTFPNDNVSILAQYQYTHLGSDLINTMSEFSAGFRYNF